MSKFAALAAAGVAASVSANIAEGQVTFALGSFTLTNTLQTFVIDDSGVTGTFNSFSFVADWSTVTDDFAFQSESDFGLTNGAGGTSFISNVGPDATFGTTTPATLTYSGSFGPYVGGTGLGIEFDTSFVPSIAFWTNAVLTLDFVPPPPPPPPPATNAVLGVNPSGMTNLPIGTEEVQWFEFTLTDGAGAEPWSISLAGSTNTGGSFGSDDTEIGLYDSDGVLIGLNDDEDFGGDILTSLLDSDGLGALADGTYYIAVGAFNTVFLGEFDVTSDSTASGETKLTVSFVPTPGAVAMLAMGGLAAARRRR